MPIPGQPLYTPSPYPSLRAPNTIPTYTYSGKKIDYSELKQLLHVCIYIWLKTKDSFWVFPTVINANALIGYIWVGHMWRYSAVTLNQIDGFYS